MKRKLSLHIKPDLAAASDLDGSPDLSPKFEPQSPLIQRRPLTPATEAQLRCSCATMVNDYMPLDWTDRIPVIDVDVTRFEVEREHERAFGYLKRPSNSSGIDRGVQDRANPCSGAKYVPRNAASGFASTTASRSASFSKGCPPSVGPDDHHPPSAVEPGRGHNPVRSQPSSDSIRSKYSTDSVSRPWWKGGSIRRYNSKSSHNAEPQHEVVPPQEVDLNRALPPLPSLSSWKPNKPHKVRHVDSQAAQVVSKEVDTKQRGLDEHSGHGIKSQEGPSVRRGSTQKPETQPPRNKTDKISKQSSTRNTKERGSATTDPDNKNAGKVKARITAKDLDTAEKQERTSPGTREKRMGRLKQQLSKMSLAGFRLHRSSSKRNGVAAGATTTAALIEAR